MTVIDLTKIESTEKVISAPICIVGGGIAGLLTAIRISEAGRRVVVIESGRDNFDVEIHNMNAIDHSAALYRRELDGRFRGLGGSSTRWGGRMIPISDDDIGERTHIGAPAWPLDMAKLEKYSDEIEGLFRVDHGSFEDAPGAEMWKTLAAPGEVNSMRVRWAKCPSFKNCNLASLLRGELSKSKNAEIWLDATVCDFEIDKAAKRLTGVTARNFAGKTIKVRADSFVIAAGTIETTRLLLQMNAAADDKIFPETAGLGNYFQDHLKVHVASIDRGSTSIANQLFAQRYIHSTRRDLHLELGRSAQVEAAAGSAFAYIAMDVSNSPLHNFRTVARGLQSRSFEARALLDASRNVGLLAKAAYWRLANKQLFVPQDVELKVMACAEQLPDWSNSVRLSDQVDRLGSPKALLAWQPKASEERTLRAIIAQLGAFWEKSGLSRLCPLRFTSASSEQVPVTDSTEACAHPSGTTRMGTDPTNSVVAHDLKCHAIPNVSVVSASVFPTAGSANPTFTIMKLAYFVADNHLALMAR
jgi:choline dehydrogenase-like flavoprotein